MPLMRHRHSPITVQKNFVHSLMCKYDFGKVHRSLMLVFDFPFDVLFFSLHATYFIPHMFVTSPAQGCLSCSAVVYVL
jgi:hypothetical protein